MCNRGMTDEELTRGEDELEVKLDLMQTSQVRQKAKVEKVEAKVDKLKKAKVDLLRLESLHEQLDQKRKVKDALAEQLIQVSRSETIRKLKTQKERNQNLKKLQNEDANYTIPYDE